MRRLFFVFGLKIFIISVSLMGVFGGLMVLTSLIPSAALRTSMRSSLTIIQTQGMYPSTGPSFRRITLDNFTDSLMLNTAYTSRSEQPLESALSATWSLKEAGSMDQVRNLESVVLGTSQATATYGRYWHGYLVFLRPLLTVLSYQQIRLVLSVVLVCSLAWLLYLQRTSSKLPRTVALFVAAVAVDFFSLGNSIQFSQVFLIGIFASIFFLTRKLSDSNTLLLFFVTGALTSFFDLLTAPLVTLGFLLIVATETDKRMQLLMRIACWSLGFLTLWVSKWVLLELFFSNGAILDAWGHVVNRTVRVPDPAFSHFQAVRLNVQQLIGYDRSNKFFALFFGLTLAIFVGLYRKITAITLNKAATWLLIAVIPYVWYLVAANHSYLHVWYTYRVQFITVAAGLLAVNELIDWQRLKLPAKAARKRDHK